MNILLVGGGNQFMNAVINKLNKEGHRTYILTGSKNRDTSYKNAYEKYRFPYDCDCLKEVFDSVDPDVTVFFGAYDSNFNWSGSQAGIGTISGGASKCTDFLCHIEEGTIYLSVICRGVFPVLA